ASTRTGAARSLERAAACTLQNRRRCNRATRSAGARKGRAAAQTPAVAPDCGDSLTSDDVEESRRVHGSRLEFEHASPAGTGTQPALPWRDAPVSCETGLVGRIVTP